MVYKTQDFWMAIWLKANGCSLVDVESNRNRHTFVFKETGEKTIEELIKEFYGDEDIKLTNIRSAYNDIKSAIYNFK